MPDLHRRRSLGQRLTDPHRVTGFIYTGTPAVTAEVTGYPIWRGYTGRDVTVVSLLTDDGEIVDHVRVSTDVMDTVKVHDLGGMAEHMVWKIADKGLFGRAGHALAELSRREREEVAARKRKDAAWTAKMRADGDRLLAGAR